MRARFTGSEVDFFRSSGLWTGLTAFDYLERIANADPDRLFVIDAQRRLSYGEVAERASRCAGASLSLGIGIGDPVLLQLPNTGDAVVAYFALARLGAIVVPRLTFYREREVVHAVEQTAAKAIVVPDAHRGFDFAAMAAEVQQRCPSIRHRVIAGRSSGSAHSFADLVEHEPYSGPRPEADDPHVVLFTSGTTGDPKGVVHSFNTASTCARYLAEYVELTTADRCFNPSPLMHTTGLLAGLLTPLLGGFATVLQDVWEPEQALTQISDHRCTFSIGAATFVSMMLDAFDLERHDLSCLRVLVCGGAPVPATLVREAAQRFGCRLMAVYGQTESTLQTATRPKDGVDRVASSDGAPVEGTTVAVVRPDGADAVPGEEGEIRSRGPAIMLGYWNQPEATRESFDSLGRLCSGDLGIADAEGYLRVTGRIKDIIIRGGMNISAGELEQLLLELPSIAAVAVVGVPDQRLGEHVCAVVVPVGAPPTLDEIVAFLRTRKIATQKLPQQLEVRHSLPMNATGKVEKFTLRAELAAEAEAKAAVG